MSDAEYMDTMESLQFSGHAIRWYVHRKNHFNKNKYFHGRYYATEYAKEHGLVVTPDFVS